MAVPNCSTVATYEDLVIDQISQATRDLGAGDLDALFNDGDTWTVE